MPDADTDLSAILEHWHRAEQGAAYARDCRDAPEAARLSAKATALMARALKIDPWRESPAWAKWSETK